MDAQHTKHVTYKFEAALEEDSNPPRVKASSLLGVIAVTDQKGYYQRDDGQCLSTFRTGVEELLGVLVGYLSGPLHPETPEEREIRWTDDMIVLDMTEVKQSR